ncbi:MAG: metallophosphoesterase family protein [Acidimicrobiia bacterium]
MLIGLLTDTHLPGPIPKLWDEVAHAFAGVDLIMHGGDIVLPSVLDELEAIAPVLAARGNNDFHWNDPRVENVQWLTVEGVDIAMVHDMEPEDEPIDTLCKRYLKGYGRPQVMITGHTHYERIDYRDGVLQVNSGSPTHPHLWSTRLGTVALLEITSMAMSARVVKLGETPDLRNPGVEYSFSTDSA